MNLINEAKKLDGKLINDGQKFSAMLRDGRVIRCYSQDGAETVAMQGRSAVKFSYRHNYAEATSQGEIIGLVWPQS